MVIIGTASQHESQTFTAKSVVLPSAYFTPTEHVIINTTQNDILVLPAAYFSPSQWTLIQRADSLKCFINVTLNQPWREMPLQDTDSARIIFSPSSVDVQEIPLNTVVSGLKRIPLLCECVREDPEGNTWSSCSHRFGSMQSNQDSLEQLCTSRCTQLQFLVLNKSLLWFEKRLRFAYLVKQSSGILSIFLLPFQPPRLDTDDAEIIVTSDEATPINPGCVYSVKTMPIKPVSSELGLGRKALSLCESLTNFLERDERLMDFASPSVDIDAANDASIFLLKNSDKLHFILQMSAFSETAVLSTCSFPSGSAIAEELLTAFKGISSLQKATEDAKISTIFAIYSENGETYLVLCTHDAVTPLALLNASNRLVYGQHQTCCVKLSLVGAVAVFRGFLVLDAFSRIDLIEIQGSSPVAQSDDDVYIFRIPVVSEDAKRKNLSLIEMSGVDLE
ncbi:unnamed protein product [Hymenolepis diminuta]|uniref:Anaphase-promoting complex subunit 1 n=1 Tax=Hymenolepis diminuta TaxID=6216 RepID=A0A0R3SJA3_HYMDI|nr:unnamed protein product [Hymenolepis diminuta]